MDSKILAWFEENSGRALSLNEIASEVNFRISDIALLNCVTALVKTGDLRRVISVVDGRNVTKFVHEVNN